MLSSLLKKKWNGNNYNLLMVVPDADGNVALMEDEKGPEEQRPLGQQQEQQQQAPAPLGFAHALAHALPWPVEPCIARLNRHNEWLLLDAAGGQVHMSCLVQNVSHLPNSPQQSHVPPDWRRWYVQLHLQFQFCLGNDRTSIPDVIEVSIVPRPYHCVDLNDARPLDDRDHNTQGVHFINMSMYTNQAATFSNIHPTEALWHINFEETVADAPVMRVLCSSEAVQYEGGITPSHHQFPTKRCLPPVQLYAEFSSPPLMGHTTFQVVVQEKEKLGLWRRIKRVPEWVLWNPIHFSE